MKSVPLPIQHGGHQDERLWPPDLTTDVVAPAHRLIPLLPDALDRTAIVQTPDLADEQL